MVMMSKINMCIQEISGAKISFRVIINQIQDDDVYNMYKEGVADDNFQSLFESLDMEDFSFDDIQIDNVLLLRLDKTGVSCQAFRDSILGEIKNQRKTRVALVNDISIDNGDLELYQKALLVLGAPVILFGGAVVGAVWGLYTASRFTIKGIRKLFSEE
ncbi:hypothetical protein BGZ65_010937 [Modicella reniformis]|uniref:Uncharacterized protein n=1 Tax=Modicella reniformis TaxID=1440133 RepID=A0A9P6MDI7_9FUNG|nr:hypothetical protein BGZ65_010937 [Modicella reniformis]